MIGTVDREGAHVGCGQTGGEFNGETGAERLKRDQ